MRIIFIGKKYEYGKPELGFSAIYMNYYNALVEMNNKENSVIFFPVDVKIEEKSKDELNEELKELIIKEKPDLIYFAGVDDLVDKKLIREISWKYKVWTTTWRFDDHWAFYKNLKHSLDFFNWVFTSDPLAIEKYHKIGYKNVIFMPQCFNHFLFKPLNLPKIYDVTFVGRPHGNRKKIIRKLKKGGINVVCFGEGWSNGRISDREMIKIISQSKINLNFSQSSGTLWKQLGLIFLGRKFDRSLKLNSPLRWHSNFQMLLAQKRKQIKGRIFKVTGCGGFLLTDYTEGLEGLYEIGKEIICFSDFDDLIKKIKYYLENDKEREKIAQAGYERSLRDHTCEKRFNEMFKIIKKI